MKYHTNQTVALLCQSSPTMRTLTQPDAMRHRIGPHRIIRSVELSRKDRWVGIENILYLWK